MGFFGWVFYCQPWLQERNPWTLPKSLQPPRREQEEEEVEEDPDEGKDLRIESPGSRESPGELYLTIFYVPEACLTLFSYRCWFLN